MEAKVFIRTLKMQKGRYAKKPNAESEKKAIESLVEKNGGKLEAVATLKEAGEEELLTYVRTVLGISKVPASKTKNKTEEVTEELGEDSKGNLYKIDTVKKTCKRILKDFSEINPDDINVTEMDLKTYQRYLKDKFEGETCTIKKGKLMFRGYRISCDIENGFMVEDTTKNYEVVETPFEGIPTPRELGDWFKKPRVEHTPEELQEAVKRGKELAKKPKKDEAPETVEDVDYEKLRKKVLSTIKGIREKSVTFDPVDFPNMIPFKRWKRKANSLLSQWKAKKIRYPKFLNELEKATEEETFVIVEKNHRSSFTGTLMPEHTEVGSLVGNKLYVDGKKVDAVPFLLEYLLCEEKRAMAQIMKFAKGEIDAKELIKNPLEQDWKVEYDKKALSNTEFNARVLCMVYDAIGITLPQDICYNSGLEEGDKIAIMLDGELRIKKVTSVDDKGVFLGKSVGYLLKHDKWFKIEEEVEE